MAEQYPVSNSYTQRLFEHYLSRSGDIEKRDEYVRRGLVPTNNLSLLIVDQPDTEIVPGTGIPNPYDYRQKPYRHIIEGFKRDQPELWELAKEVAAKRTAFMDLYWNVISRAGSTEDPEARGVALQLNDAHWANAEVYTQVINILGPQMDAEGFDPVEICG